MNLIFATAVMEQLIATTATFPLWNLKLSPSVQRYAQRFVWDQCLWNLFLLIQHLSFFVSSTE